jgi:hypothetical protein
MREFFREVAYDAVFNLYTAFGYFEDMEEDRQVARNVWRSRVPGGALVLEMMGKVWLCRDASVRRPGRRSLRSDGPPVGGGWAQKTTAVVKLGATHTDRSGRDVHRTWLPRYRKQGGRCE